MKDAINVALIGASGFTGLELVKGLFFHRHFHLSFVANTKGGQKLSDIHPALKDVVECDIEQIDSYEKIAKTCELVFLALPHGTSMQYAKKFLDLGLKVIDLSADFRLDLDTYEKWYDKHEAKEYLVQAVYGMPQINREKIKKARLIANPGCYPTASILALLPFLAFIDSNSDIYIDAKSGVSGAGRACKPHTSFVHANENFFAYGALKHRHEPEIAQQLQVASKKDFNVMFVPHLLPITRGMLICAYVKLNTKIENPLSVLQEYYANESFVRVRKELVQIKNVAGTNFCDIYADLRGNSLFVTSTIDNLIKGASGTALENANIMFGFDEDEGISKIAYVP